MLLALLLSCTGYDGALAPGTWGGEHFALTVEEDGSGFLEGDCAHASLEGPLVATDGVLEVDLDWVLEGGPTPDTGFESVPATLDATVTRTRLRGELRIEGADPVAIALRHGDEGVLYKCQ